LSGDPAPRIEVAFDDNRLLPMLFGEHETNLVRLENLLGLSIRSRGNHLTIEGPPETSELCRAILLRLYEQTKRGTPVSAADIISAVRMPPRTDGLRSTAGQDGLDSSGCNDFMLRTKRKPVSPRTPTQIAYVRAMQAHDLVFGIGPAGTGKTYLAVAHAMSLFLTGRFERLVLSRPAVEAGERLGFLPGDLREKVNPYLQPLYDALGDMIPPDQLATRMERNEVEVAPLAFMRGRTFTNALVILDEAQNTSAMQMKMFLTRLGEGSRMVITGDPTQIDLPPAQRSGLLDCLDLLEGMTGVSVVRFTEADVVRHNLVARIITAYHRRDQARRHTAVSDDGSNTDPRWASSGASGTPKIS